jgi:DNA polymerase epsilon subunit 1
MFDPLLLRMVNELMKKVFYMLMKRLSNLGMNIIFANFSRIIVATDKFSYVEAHNSIEYILKKCVEEN